MRKHTREILIVLLFLAAAYFLIFITIDYYLTHFVQVEYTNFSGSNPIKTHVLYTDGCKVPRLDPFDPTVIKYLKNITGDIHCSGKKYVCLKNNKIFLNRTEVQKDFGNKSMICTYMPIYRNPENETLKADDKFGYGEERILKFNETILDEFIRVFCSIEERVVYEEFLALTPFKRSVEERCEKNSISMRNHLNVIIIGIDSISKLNFERYFKLTAEYLRQNISAFEFNGYMKVADNTFPNLTPILTGHFVNHYFKPSNSERYFDDLDFIWKNFSSIGYRTLLAEDAPGMATYNYVKNGFQYLPTDYFFRPFTLAIEDSYWRTKSDADCFQATSEIQVLFGYLKNFLSTMENRPFFAFTWAARLTHGDVNKAGYADKPAYELLRDIQDMGLLNKSMLVFLSDHGIRFGDIRKTYLGKIEERMPFLFITFPKWFLKSHPDIDENLISNQHKLVTPFDLHETLVDLYQMVSNDYNYIRTPYGISLFHQIPDSRNCKSAFILPHWCVCHRYKKLQVSNKMAVAAAKSLVNELNKKTKQYRQFCKVLKLGKILDAMVTDPEEDLLRYRELRSSGNEKSVLWSSKVDSYEKLLITIRTLPGGGEFESTIRKVNKIYKIYDISRINKFEKQGDCINDFHVRMFCYC